MKNHHHQQQKDFMMPDIDHFDLAGMRELLEGNELSQVDIYNMIQRRNQSQNECLMYNLKPINGLNNNFNIAYSGSNNQNNYFTNPNPILNAANSNNGNQQDKTKKTKNQNANSNNSNTDINNSNPNLVQQSNTMNIGGGVVNVNIVANPNPYSNVQNNSQEKQGDGQKKDDKKNNSSNNGGKKK